MTFAQVDEDFAILSSPLEKHQLRGDSVGLVAEVIPLLREGSSAREIAAAVDISETAAVQLLEMLSATEQLNMVEPERDYFEWAVSDPEVARGAAQDTTVALLSPLETAAGGAWDDQPFAVTKVETLTALAEEIPEPDLLVSLVNGSRPALHRAIGEYTHDVGLKWLPSRLVGGEIRLGPLVQPGRGACYNCYYERALASVEQPSAVSAAHEREEAEERTPRYPEPVASLQHAMTRIEALHVTSKDRQPATEETVLAIDVFSFERSAESVFKLPGCEVCGRN